jgi:signal peptidase II
MFRMLWLAAVIVFLDQLTKFLAAGYLLPHEPVTLLPFLNLTLVHNTGAAFGFLSSASGWQNVFFIIVAVTAAAAIVVLLYRLTPKDRWLGVALALILGGAIGNLIDRLTYGYVVDFIDVFYGPWHWPAFNVADSAITVGAAVLLFDALRPGALRRRAKG